MELDFALKLTLVALFLAVVPIPQILFQWICFVWPSIGSSTARSDNLRRRVQNYQELLSRFKTVSTDPDDTRHHECWAQVKAAECKLVHLLEKHLWFEMPLAHWAFWTKKACDIRDALEQLRKQLDLFNSTHLPHVMDVIDGATLGEAVQAAQPLGEPHRGFAGMPPSPHTGQTSPATPVRRPRLPFSDIRGSMPATPPDSDRILSLTLPSNLPTPFSQDDSQNGYFDSFRLSVAEGGAAQAESDIGDGEDDGDDLASNVGMVDRARYIDGAAAAPDTPQLADAQRQPQLRPPIGSLGLSVEPQLSHGEIQGSQNATAPAPSDPAPLASSNGGLLPPPVTQGKVEKHTTHSPGGWARIILKRMLPTA